MEILLDSDLFNAQYNCNSYEISAVPISERQNLALGIVLIGLFVIFMVCRILPQILEYSSFQCLHVLCLLAMYKFALQQTAYQLMFIQGLGHVLCLFVTALLTGLFLIQGDVYCSCPILNIVAGMIALCMFTVNIAKNMSY